MRLNPPVGSDFANTHNLGVPDLTLKFKTREVVAELGDVNDSDVLVLELAGNLLDEFGGGAFRGEDVIIIAIKGKE